MRTSTNCEYRYDPDEPSGVPPELQQLARAVVLRALADYTYPVVPTKAHPQRQRCAITAFRRQHIEAQEFLFGPDTRDLAYWCALADIPVPRVREIAHDMPYADIVKASQALYATSTSTDAAEVAA